MQEGRSSLYNQLKASALVVVSLALAIVAGYSVALVLGSEAPQSSSSQLVLTIPTPTPVTEAALQFEAFGAPDVLPTEASSAAASAAPATATDAPATATSEPATATTAPATATTEPATPTTAPATATSAPASTATARPSASATARPTATPRTTPSAAPAVAAGQVFAEDTFDTAASGWPIRGEGEWLSNYVDGKYEQRLTGDKPAGVAYRMEAGDYRLAIDVEVEAGAAGLVFLSAEPSSYYWAGVAADGTYGVERIDGDQVTTIAEWKPDPAVPRDGQPARITIERKGALLMVIVGDAHVAHLATPSGSWENRYGFVISPRNGSAVARFDNLRGERFP